MKNSTMDRPTLADGLFIEVIDPKGETVEIEPDGSLGKLPDGPYKYRLGVPKGRRAYTSDANQASGIREILPDESRREDERFAFTTEFRVEKGRARKRQNRAPDNIIRTSENSRRIISFGNGGMLHMDEVGVICQEGECYMICQRTYNVRMSLKDGKVWIEDLSNWGTLMQWIQPKYEAGACGTLQKFDPDSHVCLNKEVVVPKNLGKGEGVVKFFSAIKGMGVLIVRTEDGGTEDVMLRWKQIHSGRLETFRGHLEKGDRVTYNSIEPLPERSEGKQASMKKHACGVCLKS